MSHYLDRASSWTIDDKPQEPMFHPLVDGQELRVYEFAVFGCGVFRDSRGHLLVINVSDQSDSWFAIANGLESHGIRTLALSGDLLGKTWTVTYSDQTTQELETWQIKDYLRSFYRADNLSPDTWFSLPHSPSRHDQTSTDRDSGSLSGWANYGNWWPRELFSIGIRPGDIDSLAMNQLGQLMVLESKSPTKFKPYPTQMKVLASFVRHNVDAYVLFGGFATDSWQLVKIYGQDLTIASPSNEWMHMIGLTRWNHSGEDLLGILSEVRYALPDDTKPFPTPGPRYAITSS